MTWTQYYIFLVKRDQTITFSKNITVRSQNKSEPMSCFLVRCDQTIKFSKNITIWSQNKSEPMSTTNGQDERHSIHELFIELDSSKYFLNSASV